VSEIARALSSALPVIGLFAIAGALVWSYRHRRDLALLGLALPVGALANSRSRGTAE
jgi:hypothetical protein